MSPSHGSIYFFFLQSRHIMTSANFFSVIEDAALMEIMQ